MASALLGPFYQLKKTFREVLFLVENHWRWKILSYDSGWDATMTLAKECKRRHSSWKGKIKRLILSSEIITVFSIYRIRISIVVSRVEEYVTRELDQTIVDPAPERIYPKRKLYRMNLTHPASLTTYKKVDLVYIFLLKGEIFPLDSSNFPKGIYTSLKWRLKC